MIQLFSGTPGSGKSLHTAKDIYWYANRHKEHLIVVNFAIDTSKLKHPERIIFIDNEDLKTPDKVVQIAQEFNSIHGLKENNVILIIDEAQLIFNARDWNIDGRKEWMSFFTQHRKLGFMVILVAQSDMYLDKQIRSLIEYQTIHRKVSNYGMFGFFVKLFLLGTELFVAVETWYGMKEKTGSTFFTARKKYYSLYDTYNTFNSAV